MATTDNENGAETGSPARRASVFSDVRPGMLFTYNAPRMIHELAAEVDFLYHLGRSKPNVTFRADWKAFLLTTPRSEMSLGATASLGQLHALSASSSFATDNPLQVMPVGRVDTTNAAASENGSWIASEFSTLSQRGFARYTTTEDTDPDVAVSTKSFEAGGSIGIDRRRRKDNFVLELGASYVYLEKRDPFLRQMGDRLDKQINPRGVAIWQRDFSKNWSTNLDVGVVYVNPIYNLTGDTESAPFPIFGLLAAYTDVWGRAQIAARRQVLPNLFVAQNTVSDSINVTFAMPLTFLDKDSNRRKPRVVGIGTAGFDRTQLIDPGTASTEGVFMVGRIDAAVGWQPRPGQTLGMRAEYTRQQGGVADEMFIPSFNRFTFYFTFALRWPEDVKVRVPRRSQSVRADKRDLAPIGSEPVIIDPAELLEEGSGENR